MRIRRIIDPRNVLQTSSITTKGPGNAIPDEQNQTFH